MSTKKTKGTFYRAEYFSFSKKIKRRYVKYRGIQIVAYHDNTYTKRKYAWVLYKDTKGKEIKSPCKVFWTPFLNTHIEEQQAWVSANKFADKKNNEFLNTINKILDKK